MKWFLLIAIFFGATAFMAEAFFAHGLKSFLPNLDDSHVHALFTASRYQLFAALFLVALIALYRFIPSPFVVVSQILACVGVVFFSCSLYAKYLLGLTALGSLAPMGGIAFMLSFISLLPLVFLL